MRAVTRAAGALLSRKLLAGPGNIRTVLDRVGAGTALGELPHDAAVDQIRTRLQAEDFLVQRDVAGLGAVKREHLEIHHAPSFVSASGATSAAPSAGLSAAPFEAPAPRNLPGCGTSFGSAFFTASRTVIQPPL
jgi:hypothetical protein